MEAGSTAQDYHIFCWVLEFAYNMPAADVMQLDSMNTTLWTTPLTKKKRKKNGPEVLDELSSWLFLPENFLPTRRKMVHSSAAHNGKERRNVTTGVNWKVMVSNWKHI